MSLPSSSSSSSPSWFHSTFESHHRMPDRSEQLQAATADIPDCGVCLEKVSDPIALKCGHIFDRHCIKECLANRLKSCPYDRKPLKEEEFQDKHDIYEITKCRIKAGIFSSTGSSLVSTDASIFSTREKVLERVISQYLKDSGKDEVPAVRKMIVRGSFEFVSGKTLADYHVLPGEETAIRVFLA